MEKSCSKMQVLLLFLLTSLQVIQTIEPITTSIVVGGALSAGAVYQFWDDKIKVKFNTTMFFAFDIFH